MKRISGCADPCMGFLRHGTLSLNLEYEAPHVARNIDLTLRLLRKAKYDQVLSHDIYEM
jgi:hypothetical protein